MDGVEVFELAGVGVGDGPEGLLGEDDVGLDAAALSEFFAPLEELVEAGDDVGLGACAALKRLGDGLSLARVDGLKDSFAVAIDDLGGHGGELGEGTHVGGGVRGAL